MLMNFRETICEIVITIKFFEKDKEIVCSVIDNGVGVDNKKVRKYFEPYFTTKDKGTGLGLSIV